MENDEQADLGAEASKIEEDACSPEAQAHETLEEQVKSHDDKSGQSLINDADIHAMRQSLGIQV